MAKTKTDKTAKKRPYSKERIKEAIKKGEDWRFNLVLDNDVAKKVVEEKDKTPCGAGQYGIIVNNRLRKAYGLKTK